MDPKNRNEHSHWWAAAVLFLFGSFLWGHNFPKFSFNNNANSVSPIDQRWKDMGASLEGVVDGYEGEVGLYIKDLKTGRTFEHNADRRFICASLVKVPIMAATFQAIRDGKISLNSRFKMRSYYRRDGSGNLKWARSGAVYPLSRLIYAMITQSDNTATAMVIDKLGYEYLNTCFSQFGLQETRISRQGMSLANRLDPAKDNYTTAREMGNLLEKIYNHDVVDDGLSDLMLEIMKRANHRGRLAAALPENWKFARKTGLLRKNCHDVGIVFTPEGDYVICVLTAENKNYRVAKGLISDLGRTAFEYFGQS